MSVSIAVETVHLSKRFDDFIALDDVSMRIHTHTFHALLGENGAGKTTLVKCLAGFHPPSAGQFAVHGFERRFDSPFDAQECGIGMVYQHFTNIPNMSVIENFVLAFQSLPRIVNWTKERAELERFMETMPFRVPLHLKVRELSTGENQKLEILKQLYFGRSILILDEPTSTLTPSEAEEVLGCLRQLTIEKQLTVVIITHKFREVLDYCDSVTVLRRGRHIVSRKVKDIDRQFLASRMVEDCAVDDVPKTTPAGERRPMLVIDKLSTDSPDRARGLKELSLQVSGGEILGAAGVSGNGQEHLVDVLSGIVPPAGGGISVDGAPFRPTREFLQRHKLALLPNMPLYNGFVPHMRVDENLALRDFDRPPISRHPWYLSGRAVRQLARGLIREFRIHLPASSARMDQLSGGNVQRAVLAREFHQNPRVLVAANPCFGLDFQAAAQIKSRIIEKRNQGAAVLLVSEDLDEIIELSDRIIVFFEGRGVYETPAENADPFLIGRYMAGEEVESLS